MLPRPLQKVSIFLETEGKMWKGPEKPDIGDNMALIDITEGDGDKAGYINPASFRSRRLRDNFEQQDKLFLKC